MRVASGWDFRGDAGDDSDAYAEARAGAEGYWTGELTVCDSEGCERQGSCICDRGESEGFAHSAVCFKGYWSAAGEGGCSFDDGAHVEGTAAGAGGER